MIVVRSFWMQLGIEDYNDMRWRSPDAVFALLRRVIRQLRPRLYPAVLEGNLRTPLLLLHFDLIYFLLQGSALGLRQQAQVANRDDSEQHEETHHVDAVSAEVAQVDGRGGRGERAHCGHDAGAHASSPGWVELAEVDLEEAEEEGDAAPEDEDDDHLHDALSAQVAPLRLYDERQQQRTPSSHREQDDAHQLPGYLLNQEVGGHEGDQFRQVDQVAAHEDVEADVIDDEGWPVVHGVGHEGDDAAGDGDQSQAGEAAQVDRCNVLVLEVLGYLIVHHVLHILLIQDPRYALVDSADAVERLQGGLDALLHQELGSLLNVPDEQHQLDHCWASHQHDPVDPPAVNQREEQRDQHGSDGEEYLHEH